MLIVVVRWLLLEQCDSRGLIKNVLGVEKCSLKNLRVNPVLLLPPRETSTSFKLLEMHEIELVSCLSKAFDPFMHLAFLVHPFVFLHFLSYCYGRFS